MLQSYPDQRGEVYPSWTKTGGAIGEDIELVEDRFSRSTKGVIRGFHGDPLTWKLCMCVYGSLKLVAWDIKNSKRYSFVIRELYTCIVMKSYSYIIIELYDYIKI